MFAIYQYSFLANAFNLIRMAQMTFKTLPGITKKWSVNALYRNVSLSRGRFQEIKHMMMMLTTDGLFLTCTQNSIFLFTQHIIIYLGQPPCKKLQRKPRLLGRPTFYSWWPIRIHSGPLPGSNCPPLTYFLISPHPLPTPTRLWPWHDENPLRDLLYWSPGAGCHVRFKPGENVCSYKHPD